MQLLLARRAWADTLEVRRLLPHPTRTLVGPWCFADHFGPATLSEGQGGVGPHPHIGLQTVTWVLQGAFVHGDSLGSLQRIVPGELNLMTSGRGITHWEDPEPGPSHGVQLWVALPDAHRHVEPAFAHHADLPRFAEGGFKGILMVGRHGGLESPARTFSPIVGLSLQAVGATTGVALRPDFEHAVLVTEGRFDVHGHALEPGTLAYLPPGIDHLALSAVEGATCLLLGGAPLGEQLVMWWNFVARSHDEIAQAVTTWSEGGYGDHSTFPGPPIPAPPLAMRLKPRS